MTEISPLFSPLTSTSRVGVDGNTNLASDFNNFLNLLTIQLQNQDPLEPLDTNQFTEQIVQMTEVEQTVSMNERLGALIDAQETQRIQSAIDFVGKDADALGDAVALGENGADFFYSMQTQANDVTVEIVDANGDDFGGTVVRSLTATKDAGVHRLHWDGLDDRDNPVDPAGDYRIRVTATSANGNPIPTSTGFTGRVEELRNEAGALTLLVGGRQVTLDQIVAARAPARETQTAG